MARVDVVDDGGMLLVGEPDSPEARAVEVVELHVPLVEARRGDYCVRNVSVRLQGVQPVGWRRITSGLRSDGVRLSNGKYVDTPADAIRWLGELFANAEIGDADGEVE